MERPDRKATPKRWLGLVLATLFSGGLGHFYLGLRLRGAFWLAIHIVLLLLGAALVVLFDGALVPYAGLIVAVVALWGGQIVDLVLAKPARFSSTPIFRVIVFAVLGQILFQGSAALVRSHLIENFQIPSGSMAPTLLPNDHVVIDKSRRESILPARGDLIVFEYPDPNPDNPRVTYLKRVVGHPGDTIELFHGHPYINDWQVPGCLVGSAALPGTDPELERGELFVEFLGQHSYLTWFAPDSGVEHEGPYKVRDGEVFVLGDNRWNSSDSRSWRHGQGAGLPGPNVRGHALSVLLAFNPDGSLDWTRIGSQLTAEAAAVSLPSELREEVAKCVERRPAETTPPRAGG